MNDFSEGKNKEIEEIMPPELHKFNVETRNFFATQQGENFHLKKQLVQIQKEVSELNEQVESAQTRTIELETTLAGDEQPLAQQLERDYIKDSAS